MKLSESVGEQVRRIRREADITQATLASRTSIVQSHLSEIERGLINITLETIEVLAEELDCAVTITLTALPPKKAAARKRRE